MLDPALGFKLVWLTGVINFVSIALVLLSCRCTATRFPTWLGNAAYARLYKHHCWFWAVFVLSVLAHGVLEFLTFGLPF